MSGQIISKILMALILLTGLQTVAQPVTISLPQLSAEMAKTLNALDNPALSQLDRISMISRQKSTAEIVIREHILQGLVSSDELNIPNSPISQAYKGLDALTILSEVKLDSMTNQASLDSCSRTRSMLMTSNLTSRGEALPETPTTRQTLAIINLMCPQE